MKKTHGIGRISLLISLAVLLLAACAAPTPAPTEAPAAPAEQATATPAPSTPTSEPESEPIRMTDRMGNEVVLEEPAERIISLAPGSTEIVYAVGAGDQLVGRDTFSDYPEEALSVQDIGGGFGELDIETIVSLAPDLVLASELTPPEQIQSLQDLDINVFMLSNPTDPKDMLGNLLIVGQLSGQTDDAEALVASLGERITAVEEKVATVEDRPLVFYEIDGTDPNAVWTSGPGSFVGNLITMAGGQNLGEDLESAWAQINIEELIRRDPDLILLGDYTWGGVTPEDVKARSGWEALSAVQADAIYPFDDNLVSRPGPRIVDGLEAMAELLHPELFE